LNALAAASATNREVSAQGESFHMRCAFFSQLAVLSFSAFPSRLNLSP